MSHIGNKIKDLLTEKRVSAEELAGMIGKKSKESIYGYFKKQDIDTAVIRAIAEVLDVPLEYFFDEIPKRPRVNKQHLKETIHKIIFEVLDKYFLYYVELEALSKEIHQNATEGRGLVHLSVAKNNKDWEFKQEYVKLAEDIKPDKLNRFATVLIDNMFKNQGPLWDRLELKKKIDEYFEDSGDGYILKYLD